MFFLFVLDIEWMYKTFFTSATFSWCLNTPHSMVTSKDLKMSFLLQQQAPRPPCLSSHSHLQLKISF